MHEFGTTKKIFPKAYSREGVQELPTHCCPKIYALQLFMEFGNWFA